MAKGQKSQSDGAIPPAVLAAFRSIHSWLPSVQAHAEKALRVGRATENAQFILDAIPKLKKFVAENNADAAALIALRIGENLAVLPVKQMVEHSRAVRNSTSGARSQREAKKQRDRKWAIARFAELFAAKQNRNSAARLVATELAETFKDAEQVTSRTILDWVRDSKI